MDKQNTIFVVDDDTAARDSIISLVEKKGLSAHGFDSTRAFLNQYDPLRRGCLIVDVRMAEMSGLDLMQKLRAQKNALPIIVVTGFAEVPLAVRAMQEGAFTFLEKPCEPEELSQAISQALEVENTQHAERKQLAEIESRLTTLTEDEREVFRRLLVGHPNKRIASDLDIGLRTVELRRSNIMRKMQATSLPDLVRMAILLGLLKTGEPLE